MSILSRTSCTSIILGLTLSLAACSSPRDASKENFEKVIKAEIKDIPSCDLGSVSSRTIFEKDLLSDDDKKKIEVLDSLVSLGFFEVNKRNISRSSLPATESFFAPFFVTPPEPAKVYEITAEGKKNSRADLSSGTNKSLQAYSYYSYTFCYAKGRELTSVGDFKDLAEREGMKVVIVPFKYKITGVADWFAKFPDKKIYERANSQQPDVLTLKLTNEGWKRVSYSSLK